MKGSSLFGDRSVASVSLVEQSVARWYAHQARVAFYVTAVVAGLLSMAVLSIGRTVAVAAIFGVLVGVVCGFAVAIIVRVWPVLRVLWWWSLEIAILTLVIVVWSVLSRSTSPWLAAAVLAAVLGVVSVIRRLRRWIVARAWCVIVRHRLRLCFAEFIRTASPGGRPVLLPLMLWARPTPAGERVWVWLRPGLDLADLDGKTGRMAVACWAGEVRVVRASSRYAALVRVDITRRDPLIDVVRSPLVEQFGPWDEAPAPVSPGMPPLGLDLDEVPELVVVSPPARRR